MDRKPAEVSTPSDTEVLVKRSFDAAVELVWGAYTEPRLFARWCSGPPGWSMSICDMDVRVGGKYRWRWRSEDDGKEFGFHGEFREVEPHTKLVHTEYFEAGDLGVSMGSMEETPAFVTVIFGANHGVTSVATIIKFASREDRDAALSTGMTDGMEISYTQLDVLLAE